MAAVDLNCQKREITIINLVSIKKAIKASPGTYDTYMANSKLLRISIPPEYWDKYIHPYSIYPNNRVEVFYEPGSMKWIRVPSYPEYIPCDINSEKFRKFIEKKLRDCLLPWRCY